MKRTLSRKPLQVLLFIVVMLLLVEMPQAAKRLIADPDTSVLVSSLLSLLVYPLMYAVVHIFLRWEDNTSLGDLGGAVDENIGADTSIGLIGGIVGSGFAVALALVFGGDLRPVAEITAGIIIGNSIITVLVSYVEELAYRGYLLTRSSTLGGGKSFGIFLSSIVFSLLHYSWWVPLGTVPLHLVFLFTFNLFLGGVVLSFAYFFSGRRLWAPIGFHFAWNIVAYIAFPVFPREAVQNPALFQIEWGLTTIPAFLVGLMTMWLLFTLKKMKWAG